MHSLTTPPYFDQQKVLVLSVEDPLISLFHLYHINVVHTKTFKALLNAPLTAENISKQLFIHFTASQLFCSGSMAHLVLEFPWLRHFGKSFSHYHGLFSKNRSTNFFTHPMVSEHLLLMQLILVRTQRVPNPMPF